MRTPGSTRAPSSSGAGGDPRDSEPTIQLVGDPLDEPSTSPFDPAPGRAVLGRYVLIERIGRGGGGVVYRAYDPQLDRCVALKVLRPDVLGGSSPAWAQRMLAEAQAIARLCHPNIVAVHDVGEIPPDHPLFAEGVFIVMELIDGETLSEWIGRGKPWRDVIDAMLPIGRALTAAHAAGLVHRDVKPANVLVDRDGRPRLVDFGLARAMRQPSSADAAEPTAIGTPSTMAPEQHLGERADARTDQYGFCATLHVLLHGCYPFAGDDLAALGHAKRRTPPKRVRGDIPRWLDEAVARGLAPDPAARFADMDALLARLERGRERTRGWLVAGGSVVVAVAMARVAGWSAAHAPAAECIDDGADRVEALWGSSPRAAALAGLAATGVAHADETSRLVDVALADLLARWRTVHDAACERALTTRDEPTEVGAARLACLDHALDEVGVLSELLRHADDQIVLGAADAAQRLSQPEDCEWPDARPRTEAALELVLRRASTHLQAGKHDSAEALATDALARAVEATDERAASRAHLVLCRIHAESGRSERSVEACTAAVLAAERGADDELVVRGLAHLVRVMPFSEEALWRHQLAEARLTRLRESVARRLRLDLALSLGRLLADGGRGGEAVEVFRDAIARLEETHGGENALLIAPLNQLGNAHAERGQQARAAEAYTRALAVTQHAYGEHHPYVGLLLNNLGGVELARGRAAAALVLLERARANKEASLGADSPRLVTTLTRIARSELALGRTDAALVSATRAQTIAQAQLGTESVLAAVTLAIVLRAHGRCGEGMALLDEAAGTDGLDEDVRAQVERAQALCARDGGDFDRARAELGAAISRLAVSHGEETFRLVEPLVDLAELEAAVGAVDGAQVAASRARGIGAAAEVDPRLVARADRLLARLGGSDVERREPIP